MKSNFPSTVTLPEYIQQHVNICACGKCEKEEGIKSTSVVFFEVFVRPTADADLLRVLIADHKGEFGDCNPLDGKEHGFIELGAWLGSQELALALMGLGECLGLWTLLSPRKVLGKDLPALLEKVMAGTGLLTIQSPV